MSNENLPAVIDVESEDVTSGEMVAILQRAEIDQQIATAKKYPRNIKRVQQSVRDLATLDVQTAEECHYKLPRAGKTIEGASIRFAEILMQNWGNCRCAARVVHVNRKDKTLTAEGVFHDLETNAMTVQRVEARISDKYGKLYSEDMIVIAGNAACSKAKRNAILSGIPKAFQRPALEAAKAVILGDTKTLGVRRTAALEAFGKLGVEPARVFAVLGVQSEADIIGEHFVSLRAMLAQINNGESTVDEIFDPRAIGEHEKVSDPLAAPKKGGKK